MHLERVPRSSSRSRGLRSLSRLLSLVVAVVMAATLTATPGAQALPTDTDAVDSAAYYPWTQVAQKNLVWPGGGEGVASFSTGTLLYRGVLDGAGGFGHVGDNDIAYGMQYDALQTVSESGVKAFAIGNSGARLRESRIYPHPVGLGWKSEWTARYHGEQYNNSFVAVTPDGRYLVSGGWGQQTLLYVYENPVGKPAGTPVRLVSIIRLNQTLTKIQGCDFIDSTHLTCFTDGDQNYIVGVSLAAPVSTVDQVGTVAVWFSPNRSGCAGHWESEGIDYNVTTKLLTVTIIAPQFTCPGLVRMYQYRR